MTTPGDGTLDNQALQSRAPSPLRESAVVAKCTAAVEEYRGNKISKIRAISSILDGISEAASITDQDQRDQAAGSYLGMLDQHDISRVQAASRGSRDISGEREQLKGQEGGSSVIPEVRDKRPRSSSTGAKFGSSKRRAADETLYPWSVREEISDSRLSDSLEVTQKNGRQLYGGPQACKVVSP